ncbi:MAG: DUF4974 domain-containing protein [Cyclobacteriaceae bacterium]|nr:DUF4974 domain-containing protein [Cyclobacteriaceae bacterium]
MMQLPETLIVRTLTGEASAEEQAALQEWLAQKPDHQELFDSYFEIWNASNAHKDFQPVSNSLTALNTKIDSYEKAQKTHVVLWPKIAASIVFLIATSVSVYLLTKSVNRPADFIWDERSTPAAQKSTVKLPDGSIAKLNSHSTIRFPKTFDSDLREVFCTGEVFFDVVKDSLHPFVVHTREVTTQVLGTSFNINENDAVVVVTVATGKVSVENDNRKEIIQANQKVIHRKATQELSTHKADLEFDLAWKDNILIFSDTPLDQVATTLQSWYGVNIVFENERLGNCLITGKYQNETLERVLSAISFSTGLQYTRSENNIIWSGPGCNPITNP